MKVSLSNFSKKETIRFLIGGGSAVAVDYSVYKLLLFAGVEVASSKAISYIGGAIVGFVINKFWTFESKKFSSKEILRYILLYLVSAGLNAGVNTVVLRFINITILAFLMATGVSTVFNFIGQKFFVFVKEKE